MLVSPIQPLSSVTQPDLGALEASQPVDTSDSISSSDEQGIMSSLTRGCIAWSDVISGVVVGSLMGGVMGVVIDSHENRSPGVGTALGVVLGAATMGSIMMCGRINDVHR